MKNIKKELNKLQTKKFRKKSIIMFEAYRHSGHREKQEKFQLILEFLKLFEIDYRDGVFEYLVHYADGSWGYIDYLIEKIVLIEVKSTNEDPIKAKKQALKYWNALPDAIKPPVLVVTDFNLVWFFDFKSKNFKRDCFLCELYFYEELLYPLFEYSAQKKREKFLQKMQKKDTGGNQNHFLR